MRGVVTAVSSVIASDLTRPSLRGFFICALPPQRLAEFWEDEIRKAAAAADAPAARADAAGAGAPSVPERDVAFASWMRACRLLEVEATELEVRTRAGRCCI